MNYRPHPLSSRPLVLINATQHSQAASLDIWRSLGVDFTDPDFAPYSQVSPKQPIHDQIVEAWRKLQGEMDRCFNNDLPFDGFLLGGYAPMAAGLYSYVSQFRRPSYCAVMGPAPMVDGQRRMFVLSGYRRIPSPKKTRQSVPQEGQPMMPEALARLDELERGLDVVEMPSPFYLPNRFSVDNFASLVHVAPHALTEQRRAELSCFTGAKLISSMPALPPAPDENLFDYYEAVNDILRLVVEHRCPVLFDGPPVETLLRLYSVLGQVAPCHYVKTEMVAPAPGEKPRNVACGIAKMPRI